ncbi:hypothetical protein PoB_004279800 [Plakobranchus ocellatus]|uniref:Uncharacterized protein n=1 Tax=Plakobranchus ocellatus TaxID=259542 RepID=A0AAV4BAV5_9GAST|nr:hypothetical protein PoB_004279800 [Plakobranchus ocellatus]
MECPTSSSKSQSPSKSRPPSPAQKPPRSSAFLLTSLPLHPRGPCDGGGEATQENQRLGGPAEGWPAKQQIMDTVVQWNIRGLRSNFEELRLLLNRLQSAVVVLQKCRLGEGQSPPRGYTLLPPQGVSSGGEVALLIRNGTRFSEIVLNTGLHVAAATLAWKI